MKISITTNFPEIARSMDAMRTDIANKAMASALNKTAALAKTAMSREIRQEFVLSASKVGAALRVVRASGTSARVVLQAALESPSKRGRSLNLANFEARKTAKGISFKIRRAGGRKAIPGAFFINNGKTVMIRVGKQRLPIKALQTIDIAQMFNTKRINARVVGMIKARLPTVFAAEARYFTERFNQAKE